MRHPTKSRTGFTLLELLVVMSIMSMLIAFLMPAMGRARESAKQVICRNNLRSIWTGVLQYAFTWQDRVPYMEDINLSDPNADPFDPRPEYESTVGRVLASFVNEGSWVCPSAIRGYPANAPAGAWKMTYWFRTAGPVGEGVPYSQRGSGFISGTGRDALGPLVSNYVNFDGRPIGVLSGRRHTPSNPYAPNRDAIGPWTFTFPIIADLIEGNEAGGRPRYPHKGVVEKRTDLLAAQSLFERNAGTGRKPARMELHANGDQAKIMLTRVPFPHRPGF